MSHSSRLLRYARRRAGLTQRRLAERAGIAQPAIARIESGRVSPTADTMDRLIEACGLRLVVEDRPGRGIDRTAIKELLRLTPGQRLAEVAAEARSLDALT
jgi:transcriptional regulator with XRE-family HTH domain